MAFLITLPTVGLQTEVFCDQGVLGLAGKVEGIFRFPKLCAELFDLIALDR